jgi:hypothetical protein
MIRVVSFLAALLFATAAIAQQAVVPHVGARPVTETNPLPVSSGGALSNSTAVFEADGTISGDVDLGSSRLVGIAVPDSWQAASITFQVSADCSVYWDLYDATGTEYTVTAAAERHIAIPLADFIGVRCLRVRSGTSAVTVDQPALSLTLVGVR